MFREDKTTQMAARFLQLAGGCLPYTQLMKLLYVADKQMLVEHGKPITYDRWFALKYGPALSSTYNLIKEEARSAYWSEYIKTENSDVTLSSNPGTDALSIAEDRIIDKVFAEYKGHSRWPIADAVHESLAWEDMEDPSKQLTYEAVLRVEGFDEEDIAGILENIRVQEDTRLVLEAL